MAANWLFGVLKERSEWMDGLSVVAVSLYVCGFAGGIAALSSTGNLLLALRGVFCDALAQVVSMSGHWSAFGRKCQNLQKYKLFQMDLFLSVWCIAQLFKLLC